jgi:hypothetical protein
VTEDEGIYIMRSFTICFLYVNISKWMRWEGRAAHMKEMGTAYILG